VVSQSSRFPLGPVFVAQVSHRRGLWARRFKLHSFPSMHMLLSFAPNFPARRLKIPSTAVWAVLMTEISPFAPRPAAPSRRG
jgi:hypothetical protein